MGENTEGRKPYTPRRKEGWEKPVSITEGRKNMQGVMLPERKTECADSQQPDGPQTAANILP